jgi:hypothetical protein
LDLFCRPDQCEGEAAAAVLAIERFCGDSEAALLDMQNGEEVKKDWANKGSFVPSFPCHSV